MSVVDLTCHLEKGAKYTDIKKVVKQAVEGPLKGILGYSEDQESPVTSTVMPTALPHAWAGVALADSFGKLISWCCTSSCITIKVDAVDGDHRGRQCICLVHCLAVFQNISLEFTGKPCPEK